MINSERRAFFGRAAGEIVIIIVGVLIAFQFADWRVERESKEQELAQMAALQADFNENLRRLQNVLSLQEGLVASQKRLLGIIHGHEPRPDAETIKKLVTDSFRFFRLEAVMGADQSLVSSGDMRLLQDQDLRTSIAGFAGTLGDGYEDEGLGNQLRVRLFEEMTLSTDLLAVLEPGFRKEGSLPESSKDPDIEALLENRAYRNHLTVLAFTESGQLSFYQELNSKAQRIVENIEQYR